MTRTRELVLLGILALLAGGCGAPPAGASPSPTPAASALRSGGTPTSSARGAVASATERDIAAPCIAGGPTVAGDAVLWTACESMTGVVRGPAQILEYQLSSGTKRVLHTASRTPPGVISLLRASDAWIMWAEYTDFQRASDTKIYAQRRSGGDPVLLDDASRYGPLANLMETALDGSEAYWSRPLIESGIWHGLLMHRTLPDGAPEIALTAPVGSIITWPSVRDGAIAYERSSQTASPQTRVVLRSRDGTEREIGDGPSSEPSLGDGFVAFKQAERFSTGELGAFVSSTGKVMTLGAGEAPVAFGGFVTWKPTTPTDSVLRLAAPLSGCVNRLGDLEVPIGFPTIGHTVLAWTHTDLTLPPGPTALRIRYASVEAMAATPCK